MVTILEAREATKGLTSSKEDRRAAETELDEFAAKIAANTSKDEIIGVEDPITRVEVRGGRNRIKS